MQKTYPTWLQVLQKGMLIKINVISEVNAVLTFFRDYIKITTELHNCH